MNGGHGSLRWVSVEREAEGIVRRLFGEEFAWVNPDYS